MSSDAYFLTEKSDGFVRKVMGFTFRFVVFRWLWWSFEGFVMICDVTNQVFLWYKQPFLGSNFVVKIRRSADMIIVKCNYK